MGLLGKRAARSLRARTLAAVKVRPAQPPEDLVKPLDARL